MPADGQSHVGSPGEQAERSGYKANRTAKGRKRASLTDALAHPGPLHAARLGPFSINFDRAGVPVRDLFGATLPSTPPIRRMVVRIGGPYVGPPIIPIGGLLHPLDVAAVEHQLIVRAETSGALQRSEVCAKVSSSRESAFAARRASPSAATAPPGITAAR